MPNTKAAKKALRQNHRRWLFNVRRKRKMKQIIKQIEKSVSSKNPEEAQKQLPEAYKAIDKAAKRGVIKKNTAARKKSRLSKTVKQAS